jgi:lipoate---protein ligase
MRIIYHTRTDIHFCLAAEAYFLEHGGEDVALIWQSHNAVVCGKHQVALRECDYRYCRENNITVARRISGGGTVFHDAGNICFTFIRSVADMPQQAIDFRQHTMPVVDLLRSLGVDAAHSGRNDILAGGLKISGNAEHLDQRRKKVLHHGTLLFDSDLANLGRAIRGNEGCYEDKGVRSVRSRVTNIAPLLSANLSLTQFIDRLTAHLAIAHAGAYAGTLQAAEIQVIEAIMSEKFMQEKWIFGYSPAYSFQQEIDCAAGVLAIRMTCRNGIIQEANLQVNGAYLEAASRELAGMWHHAPDFDNMVLLLPPGFGLEEMKRVMY